MILDHLAPSERQLRQKLLLRCADAAVHLSVSRGKSIYCCGDRNRDLYLLERGKVWIGKVSATGKVIIFQVIRPGQVFGETALITNGRREEEARAAEDSTCLAIPIDRFRRILSENPSLTEELLEFLSRRVIDARKRVSDLALNTNRERLAKFLMEEARARGIRDNGAVYLRLGLTHEQLAQVAGTSREMVTSILNELRRCSLIDYQQGSYTIFYEKLERYLSPLEKGPDCA